MKQTKIETMIFFAIIVLYYILCRISFLESGTLYNVLINPLFWIILAIILKLYVKKIYTTHKMRKEILDYTLISVLAYIILYLMFGFLVSFGKNPNSTSIKGIFINFWINGTVIICREYIRYLIINNVFGKQKKKVCIFSVIIFTLLELKNINIISINGYYIFKQIFSIVLPTISKNILFTYIATCKFYWPSIMYELLINLVLWTAPILPNLTWVMTAIIDISIPVMLLMYVRYIKNNNVHYKLKDDFSDNDPKSIITLIAFIVVGIWFALGVFPVKPVAIASGSMEPKISVGDVAIIKKCGIEDIKIGDVIEYKRDHISVIHRVVEIGQENGVFYIIAKGDSNETIDMKIFEEQLIGKYIFGIKYLGYPAVWMSNARTKLKI